MGGATHFFVGQSCLIRVLPVAVLLLPGCFSYKNAQAIDRIQIAAPPPASLRSIALVTRGDPNAKCTAAQARLHGSRHDMDVLAASC